jgi:hypothetical protein
MKIKDMDFSNYVKNQDPNSSAILASTSLLSFASIIEDNSSFGLSAFF